MKQSTFFTLLGSVLIMAAWLIWGFEPPMLPVTVLVTGMLLLIYAVVQYAAENIRESEAEHGES